MDMLPSESSQHGIIEISPYRIPKSRNEEAGQLGPSWYFSRKEIEENSPSKKDGISSKKESYLRKSYCTFLQDLGMRLKVPQATIATSIVFCHRFYLRQSHAKNDRRTIATVCMFLAGKVEETPRPLKDVILVSYDIIHKKDPAAGQKIKQREVYDKQKELILLGERVVLGTLGFDLNVHHPYKPLVEAIKKYKIVHNALAQVAWNFINDGLRTSLCLQFKPHHIAAGALVLASKFLKVKFLPDDSEKAWYQDFDVTPRQLEEVSNQLLELYEQNCGVQSRPIHLNEAEGSSASASAANQQTSVKARGNSEESSAHEYHQASKQLDSNHSTSTGVSIPDHSKPDKQIGSQKILHNDNGDHGSNKTSTQSGGRVDAGIKDGLHHDTKMPGSSGSSYKSDNPTEEQKPLPSHGSSIETRDGIFSSNDGPGVSSSMMDAMHKIDKDKVKAALEKRRKLKGDFARKVDMMDDDDLLERELEHGVELAVEDEKIKRERSHASAHQDDKKSADEIADNGHHDEQSMPETAEEAKFATDVEEQHSPQSTKRNDGFEHMSKQSHHAPEHLKGHNDA